MTQELINKYFETGLGQQCSSLFVTVDNRVFIRYSEAKDHCEQKGFDVSSISEWFEDEPE